MTRAAEPMKKLLLLRPPGSLAALAAGLAAPAFAAPGDATGVVDLQGTVTAKCSDTGTSPVTIDLGELAQANGKVVTSFAGTTHADLTFACTSAKPTVNVT